ncbi:TRAFAC clade GTPase domain-containing protein [Kangiella sp.]|uniref:TRAFAC clade GTPase domain-containing protein n=1 Tax=Kangiella sp. TaxID=1920245 RepID=UPI003A93D247
MEKCSNPNCFADDNTSCADGHMTLQQCPAWNKDQENGDESHKDQALSEHMMLPWSGLAMGGTDLNFITGKGKPITIGIVGPESAGKTTILAALYLLLSRGAYKSEKYRFSNSYTLSGWEAVANSLRWLPGQPPNFPAHTPSGLSRSPGMLHLAFRQSNHELRDFLFADAPGEWFQKWSVNQQSEDAEGACWVSEHADVILLIADREALAGSGRGRARNDFQLLAQRVISEMDGRPMALVWTKGDIEVAPAMEEAIRKAVSSYSSDLPEFTLSIRDTDVPSAQCLHELFDWVFAFKRSGVVLPETAPVNHDPLFRFGRK